MPLYLGSQRVIPAIVVEGGTDYLLVCGDVEVKTYNYTKIDLAKFYVLDATSGELSLHKDFRAALESETNFYAGWVRSSPLPDPTPLGPKSYAELFMDIEARAPLNFSGWQNTDVTSMASMFAGCRAMSYNFTKFSTQKATNLSGMFMDAKPGPEAILDLTPFKTARVTNIGNMFKNCDAGVIDVSSFKSTGKLKNFKSAFQNTTCDIIDLRGITQFGKKPSFSTMFQGAAATICYVGNEDAKTAFETSSRCPSTIVFTIV